MQRGHGWGRRCHHCAHRLDLKHNHPIPGCFRGNRICPGARGCAPCHPGWWQHPAAADGFEMSLRIGLQMTKHTMALALAIKIFAVAGREKQRSSNGRCPGSNPSLSPGSDPQSDLPPSKHLSKVSGPFSFIFGSVKGTNSIRCMSNLISNYQLEPIPYKSAPYTHQ